MESHGFLKWVSLLLNFFIIFNHSFANQTKPISHPFITIQFSNQAFQWRNYYSTVLAGILCFVAASISSAGGLGGGGLFLPILNIVAGFDLKKASSFSAFMVTGGSFANVIYHLCIKNPRFGGKNLIDYDITLISEPCMLLGVSVGVICNVIFPEWLITLLFAVFLAWTTFKTCKSGVLYWKEESEEIKRVGFGKLENSLVTDKNYDGIESHESMKEPLLGRKRENGSGIPGKKLGVLIMIWVSFFVLNVLRGDRNKQSVIKLEPCGVGYWIISAFQVPVAIAFTAWILHHKESSQDQIFYQQEIGAGIRSEGSCKVLFPVMAFIAGILGGVFGIGGGMLISPLLLHVGIKPEVTAATCSYMVLFSSSMSAVQYTMIGVEKINEALIFTLSTFIASFLGLAVVQRAVTKNGRSSLIIFSVGTVMALSTILITSFGALNVWRDYINGKSMGFRLPC